MRRTQKTSLSISPIILVAILAASCFLPVKGFRDPQPPPAGQTEPAGNQTPPAGAPEVPHRYQKKGGVYHTVQQGQTVSRIAEAYDVPPNAIIAANGLKDPSRIKVGQVLFIPGAQTAQNVDPANGGNPRQPPVNPPPNNNPRNPPFNPPVAPPPPPSACPPGAIAFIWPATGQLTSGFGMRNGRHHDGIDLSASIGTPVHAAADGVVIFADRLGGYGLIVIIKHEGDLKTVYAHNRKNLVKKGDIVKQGDVVAELGNSGNAVGPHVHFEVRCGQKAVNPIPYLPKR